MSASKIIILPERPCDRFTRWGATLAQAMVSGASRGGANRFAPRSCEPLDGEIRLASLVVAANRVAMRCQVRQMAQAIRAHAESVNWSQRETEKQTGLSRRTITRFARGEGRNLEAWLPRLSAAVAKLRSLQ